MTSKHPSYPNRSALLLIEEAVHLLRRHPLELMGIYLFGSCPFVLAFLFFWADMSRSAFAAEHCAVSSLGLALLFVWMKACQAVFSGQVTALLQHQKVSPLQEIRWLSVAATQTFIQASALLVLPLAALIMLPFGWCFAFYQNVTALGLLHAHSTRSLFRQAWRQARLWPRQNHLLLGVLSLFSVVVLLNVAIVLFALPHLLKTFLGVDSVFTLSGGNAVNTTFWAACVGIGYLAVDPLFKTAYAIRCFYGAALSTGEDLKVSLFRLRQAGKTAVVAILLGVLFLCGHSLPLMAGGVDAVEPETLEESIEEVLKQPHFSWRMPRQSPQQITDEPKGPLDEAVEWCVKKLQQGIDILAGWIDTLVDWLIDLLPMPSSKRQPDASSDWRPTLRVLLMLLLAVLCGMLGFVLWRSRLRPSRLQDATDSAGMAALPDIGDESLAADAYPSDKWLQTARDMVAKGDLRLAMRAFYLATLVHLAALDWINIEKHKTHRDYLRELTRRRRERPELIADFRHSGLVYERVWFGMRTIAAPELHQFTSLQKRIMAVAEK